VIAEQIAVTLLVIDALEKLGVRYLIGGSLASAIYGVPRATMDADLVADLRVEHAEALARALADAFYVDAEMIRDAVRQQRSFNVIHLETAFKVDVFVRSNRSGVMARSVFCDEAISALRSAVDNVGDCFAKIARNDRVG